MTPQRRRIRLLLHDDGRLVDASGSLPHLDVTLRENETTCEAAWRVLPELGLHGPLLDTYVDPSGVPADDGGELYAALVELDGLPPGWSPPPGWSWRPVSGAPPDTEPGLRGALAARLAELRGDVPVHPLRMPWARPGWFERATAWIDAALVATGRSPSTSIVQFRNWGISAVMKVESESGRCWFKAASGPMQREAAITALVHAAQPGSVAPVVAAEENEGWLLLGDIGGDVVGENPAPTRAAFERLLEMQIGLADRTTDLLAAGCPHRPLDALVDAVAAALASPSVLRFLDATPARVDELMSALSRAVDEVTALGVPDALVHGDFHPGNVMTSPRGITIFDWSDAALSNPLVDVPTWTWWFESDPERVDSIHRTFHDVRSARLGHAAGDDLESLDRRSLAAVAGGYHLVSYAGIVAALEPHRQLEHANGVEEFFALLSSAAPG